MSNEPRPTSGLFCGPAPIPLQGVRIHGRSQGAAVSLTVTQRFTNVESTPIEAVYVFPLDEGAAVHGFAARVDGRIIEGQVLERDEAFERYDDAMLDGDGAFLLDQERPNIFTASIGNIAPGATVDVELRYVTLAAPEGAGHRICIPTTVAPRYVAAPDQPAVGQPDGERINPPRRFEVPYGLSLRLDIEAAIGSVESPSHPVKTTLTDRGAVVELINDTVALDGDVIVVVTPRDAVEASAVVARDAGDDSAVMLTFTPALDTTSAPSEVVFVVDCSGSMQGDSIHQAKRALELCVRALSPGDTFNIVRFGSSHTALWSQSRTYDESSLQQAVSYIRATEASLGGTEILTPLKALLDRAADPERPRQILLLTDGQVSNEAAVLELARTQRANGRVFSFGIGHGASEHLVRGLARASRGAAEMILPGERIESKVLRMFGRVRSPMLDDLHVDWGGLDVEQSPRETPPVFAGDRVLVFGRIKACGQASSKTVALVAGGRRWELNLDLERAESSDLVPTLWARHAIRDLEERLDATGSNQRRPEAGSRRKAALVELAKRYSLMSSATSFVAVEQRADGAKTVGQAALRHVPVSVVRGGAAGFAGGPVPQLAAAAPRYRNIPVPRKPAPAAPKRSRGLRAVFGKRAKRAEAAASGGFADALAEAPAAAPLAQASAPRAFDLEGADGFLAEEASADALDVVFELLMTQRADGSFGWSSAFEAFVGDADAVDAARTLASRFEPRVVVTAYVVAWLQRFHSARAAEWRAASAKASSWLAAQADTDEAQQAIGVQRA